jgi:beta-aspartyl-peptidase (threonine type)
MIARIALVLLLAGSAFADEGEPLRKVVAEQVVAWNRHDLDGFMRGYWRSPELTFYGGSTVTKGWDATLLRYRKKYQEGGAEMGTLELTIEDARLLGHDDGVVRGRWHLKFSTGKEAGGLTTLLFRRFPDGWKIVHDHSS